MPSPRPTLAVVLLLVAVPLAGCADITNASRDGYGETWGAKMVQADKLHERGLTGDGVKVAIIDTGIDLSHPEFKGKDIQWADLVNQQKTAYDDHGHGTHVAGI
ncbi:MAG TPA: S8 family serine peptidase, partial [Candidatus Thermoplasmatota archaeon]|nr:S8 family serine peptidase [Candidatus Thermoplasmatota archaeon]